MKIKIMIALAATTLVAQAQTNLIFSTNTIYLAGTNWWTNMSVVGTGGGVVVSNPGPYQMPAIIATNAFLSGLRITNLGTGDLIGNWYDIGGPGPNIAQLTTINDCLLVVTGAASHAINFHADLSGTNLFRVNMHNVEFHTVYEGFEQNNVVGVYDSCRWFAKSVGSFALAAGLDTGTNRISNCLLSATGNGYGPNMCWVNGIGSETTFSHCVFHIEPSSMGNSGGPFNADSAWTFDHGDVFAIAESCLFELNSIGNPAPVSMMQVNSSTTGTVKLINCFYYPETNGVIIVNNSHLQFIVEGGNLTPTNFYNPSMVTWVDASATINTLSGSVLNFQAGQQHLETPSNLSITGFSGFGDSTKVYTVVLTVHNTSLAPITISWPAQVRDFVSTSPVSLPSGKVWRATWSYDGQTNLWDLLQTN